MVDENKKPTKGNDAVVVFDVKKASREEIEAFTLKQQEVIDKQDVRLKELDGHVEGLDEQCTELAVENRELRVKVSEQPAATSREAFLAERVGRAPRYIPPRKLKGAELEAAKLRVLKRYKDKIAVNVGPTWNWAKDDKGRKVRVQDKTKPTHEPLRAEHIIGINEGDDKLTAILVDTQKLRIEKGGK